MQNYILGNMIGKGSDGEVYELLEDGYINNKVIKFIQPRINQGNKYLEPYILLHLNHENIMKAEAIEMENNGLLKIIQLRAELDLLKKISNKHIKAVDKIKYMREITEGINFLHQHHILHGDIKPNNILLLNNTVKLTDFSLSRVIDKGCIINYNSTYTLCYRPPEVKENKLYLKSDIWALGCTLYEIFYGTKYFVLTKELKLYHIANKSSPGLFDGMIAKMIEKNIDERFSIEDILPFFNIVKKKDKYIPMFQESDNNFHCYDLYVK
jgi:serine/threonine protein kinase